MTEWEPATEAEIAMRDALRANDQEQYFRILARTDILLPIAPDAQTSGDGGGWGTWTTEGRTHVLAFTSPTALHECLAGHPGTHRRVPFRDLAGIWPNVEWWLAVNPGLPIEGYLPSWFVTQISRGDVRLPGRTLGARARMDQAGSRARAVAQVPVRPVPNQPAPTPIERQRMRSDQAGQPPSTFAPRRDVPPPDVAPPGAFHPTRADRPVNFERTMGARPDAPVSPPSGGFSALGGAGGPVSGGPVSGGPAPGAARGRAAFPRRGLFDEDDRKSLDVPNERDLFADVDHGPGRSDLPRRPTSNGAGRPAEPAPGAGPPAWTPGAGAADPGSDEANGDPRRHWPRRDPSRSLGEVFTEHADPVIPAAWQPPPVLPSPAGLPLPTRQPQAPQPPFGVGGTLPSRPSGALDDARPTSPAGESRPAGGFFGAAAPTEPAVGWGEQPVEEPRAYRPEAGPLPRRPGSEQTQPISSGWDGPGDVRPVSPGPTAVRPSGGDPAGEPAFRPAEEGPVAYQPAGEFAAFQTGVEPYRPVEQPAPYRPVEEPGAVAPFPVAEEAGVLPAEPLPFDPPGSGRLAAEHPEHPEHPEPPEHPEADNAQGASPFGEVAAKARAAGFGRSTDLDQHPFFADAPDFAPVESTVEPFVEAADRPPAERAFESRSFFEPVEAPAPESPFTAPSEVIYEARIEPRAERAPDLIDVPTEPVEHPEQQPAAERPFQTSFASGLDAFAEPHAAAETTAAAKDQEEHEPSPELRSFFEAGAAEREQSQAEEPAYSWSYTPETGYEPEVVDAGVVVPATPEPAIEDPPAVASPPATSSPPAPDFHPANNVEQDLFDAVQANSTDRFLSTLLLAKVIVPLWTGEGPVEPTRWRTEHMNGVPHLVVFSSQERMADRLGPDMPGSWIKFTRLIRHWPPGDELAFAINPESPAGAVLPGTEVVQLATWAAEMGLGVDEPDEQPGAPKPTEASQPRPTFEPPTSSDQLVMQKPISPEQLSYYLERNYDRVSGFVHRASEVAHLETPEQLYNALGLDYAGSSFKPDAGEVYVLRWIAYRGNLYRIPYGGSSPEAMRAMRGWVIERAPFRGNGFAPSETSDVIAEFKVDSARLPHDAELWRLRRDGRQELIARLDADGPNWRKTGAL
ncbi:SseB family protein [Dactylosporangium roseum]|uniref:SseB family protein n=1 Tax=Dactylosporangium roseum TaxID=47989 RepID=A0ABY5Z536_9ACTN|nr:SseB family protein [Dactylosporangium roseum]